MEDAEIPEAEKALLRFVKLVTTSAYRTTPDDVQKLRDVGWTDEQIGEAVYVTAMFAMFNRVADAFGLKQPGLMSMARRGEEPRPPAESGGNAE